MKEEPLRVLVAPDKFKGCLSAQEVTVALAEGLRTQGIDARELPLADGGDGSVEAAVAAGFQRRSIIARGRAVDVAYDPITATGLVEVAGTCGLHTEEIQLPPAQRSTAALGEAVRAVYTLGARRVVLALGGSSTTDGGLGLLHALGVDFLDARGDSLPPVAASLGAVTQVIDRTAAALLDLELVIATDVDNPLCGPTGAARVFGPQKGLAAAAVAQAETDLRHYVQVLTRTAWPRAADVAAFPGAGAAGGLGFAGMLLGGTRVPGAAFFLDLLGFDHAIQDCHAVITGEGRLDLQTGAGKLPAVVAQRSGTRPVLAAVGRCDLDVHSLAGLGFVAIASVSHLAGRDTSTDRLGTASTLHDIGSTYGARLPELLAAGPVVAA